MMLRPVRVTSPTADPVLVDDVKAFARIDHDDDQKLITAALLTAVAYLDGYDGILGRCMVEQTWRQAYRCWRFRMKLPLPDVTSATVSFRRPDGSEAVLEDGFHIENDMLGSWVVFDGLRPLPALLQSEAAVTIDFVAGYGRPGDVPETLKTAIKMLALHWYDHPEAVTKNDLSLVPLGVRALIARHRWIPL
ncbi:putative phiE125 gp8 family phage protein [Palleronia aestuarii]|uniref:Putative phiE125 gp8 family phage protein n=1 Tax=Palleronia aestuarii TaxID=568105 RepID=A0A2W7NT82_9RHOB|nr:head-tail connector protein [Palleronia aestuarii]PZX19814.1 putative phiE125 gp8 family phage protein [Palleronia aestuarii]